MLSWAYVLFFKTLFFNQEAIYNYVCNLPTLVQRAEVAKLGRWFSWNGSAKQNMKHFSSVKAVIDLVGLMPATNTHVPRDLFALMRFSLLACELARRPQALKLFETILASQQMIFSPRFQGARELLDRPRRC